MKGGFRQSMAWLHTWTGLLVGWVLFFVFVTGTLGYVNAEIDHWMQPEEPMAITPAPAEVLLPVALARFAVQHPDAEMWQIDLPGGRRMGMHTWWRDRPHGEERYGEYHDEALDPATGAPIPVTPRKTGGGHALYRMHYQLHYLPYDWAIRIVGVCTMFMLVAIVSGIITHKKIFKDFFAFRPGKGQRSWLDGHNVLSVTALPFHLMITYSGLIFFMFAYMPVGPSLLYGKGGIERFYREAYGEEEHDGRRIAPAARQAPILPMLAVAKAEWGAAGVRSISITNPGRADAKIEIDRREGSTIGRGGDRIFFDGTDGRRLHDENGRVTAAAGVNSVLLGLHEGVFAGGLIRILYVFAGLSGAAMIGTGLVLWSIKRKAKLSGGGTAPLGIAVVDRLTLGTFVGLPIAIAAYFWANRAIPVGLENREAWEMHTLFGAWAAAFIYPIWRPLARGWLELSWMACAAFGLLPLVNIATTDRGLTASIPAGDGVLIGFDLCAFGIAAFFGWLAIKQRRKARSIVPKRGRRARSAPAPISAETAAAE